MNIGPSLGLAVAAIALAHGAAFAQEAAAPQPVSEAADDVELGEDRRSRMTVPIHVNGRGPYNFLVDTGAERTVISAELARKLQLDQGRGTRVHSMSGATEVTTAFIPTLQVSRNVVNGIHAPALKEAHIGAAGMLGIDSLKAQVVVFDFENQKMTVRASRSRAPVKDPDEIVVSARSRFGRLVLVDARIDGQKIMVILDTGSEVTIGNTALRTKLEGKRRLPKSVPIELVSVTGGTITADYSVARRVEIGGVTFRDLPVAYADVHPFKQLDIADRPALLLGMDALRLFDRVSVDFANRKVRFLTPDAVALAAQARSGSAAF